jgi:hypothetical protein
MRPLWLIPVCLASLVGVVACSKETTASEPAAAAAAPVAEAVAAAPAAAPTAAPAPAAPAVAPEAKAEAAEAAAGAAGAPQYTIAPVSVTLKPGAAGSATVVIKPGAGLHFNEEYPAKFTVSTTTFAKPAKEKLTFKEGDLKVVGGNGELVVPLQGLAAGEGPLDIVGSFSVCSDETCHMLKEQKFSIQVAVK